ncbi:MAG: APC family permease [Nocardiaceae bacterium]|nr:APC family permease [Nocardiaceae bacterium]
MMRWPGPRTRPTDTPRHSDAGNSGNSGNAGAGGRLGVAALVSIGIGGMVGGGIFSVLGLTVQIAGAGAYASFVVGGVAAALTGSSYARLSVLIRDRGGTATFLDRAFGTGFAGPLNLLLWLSYFVMLGLYALAFGSYLASLVGLDPTGVWRKIFATSVVLVFAGLNMGGAQLVGRAESVLVYFKLSVLVLFCVAGLWFVNIAKVSPSVFPPIYTIVYGGALIFLAYEGFELIANAAEDARDPERSLPRAYLMSIGVVIFLYVLVAFVAVGNLTPQAIVESRDYALAAAARPFLGSTGFVLIGVAAVVSTASAINATLYGAAKFTFLMARHGELPKEISRPIWHRPIGGLVMTAVGTIVIVNTVDIEGISLMGSSGFLIIFAAVNVAAIRLAGQGLRVWLPALAGAVSGVGCLVALLVYATLHIPTQLTALAAMIVFAVTAEVVLHSRRRVRGLSNAW